MCISLETKGILYGSLLGKGDHAVLECEYVVSEKMTRKSKRIENDKGIKEERR